MLGQSSSSTVTTDSDLFNTWSSSQSHYIKPNPVAFPPFNLHFPSVKFSLSEQIEQHLLHRPGYNPHEMRELWHVEDTFTEYQRLVETHRPETERELKSPTKSVPHIRYCEEQRVILWNHTILMTNLRINTEWLHLSNWAFRSPRTGSIPFRHWTLC